MDLWRLRLASPSLTLGDRATLGRKHQEGGQGTQELEITKDIIGITIKCYFFKISSNYH